MKFVVGLVLGLIVMCAVATAQLKSQIEQPSVSQSLVHPRTSISSFLGLLNPDNFLMRHSVSLSYFSAGGRGISLASYTNSMFYRIADPLNVRVDVTLQGSPFGSYGSDLQGGLNSVYLSRAEVNYQPSKNFFIQLQYHQLPFYHLGTYNPFLTPSFREDE